ncbi:hypothetical protein HORIV_35350 [Vreelandella olivaria]|uniref:Uncharacterized protein n=1 Tax=Vreelandella olivaria TaxID=390919 RepID=A0ABM7GKD7_9GAMM|nr:hypothetical protein HORIV_35350 [Halomonas olivaria]
METHHSASLLHKLTGQAAKRQRDGAIARAMAAIGDRYAAIQCADPAHAAANITSVVPARCGNSMAPRGS